MPRYLVEQTFGEAVIMPANEPNGLRGQRLLGGDAPGGVRWLHTYLSADRRRAYCLCDAPSPEAVRLAVMRHNLPVDRITEVHVLDRHFYT
jgi:hypothetical protein